MDKSDSLLLMSLISEFEEKLGRELYENEKALLRSIVIETNVPSK
ncbi:hypothetical protein [Shouchella patagoniensis]|nr:hypothetical protein [Shouchella patagoniensis]